MSEGLHLRGLLGGMLSPTVESSELCTHALIFGPSLPKIGDANRTLPAGANDAQQYPVGWAREST